MSHSVSMIRIRGSSMDRTRSSVSSSELPTFTTTSSQTGRIDRMLASSGKSSLMPFRTIVKPEIWTRTRVLGEVRGRKMTDSGGAIQGRGARDRRLAASAPRVNWAPMHVALFFHDRLPVKGYGGTQRVVVWLARGLAELGHEVTLLGGPGVAGTRGPADARRHRAGPRARIRHPAALSRAGTDILHSFVADEGEPDLPWLWTQEGNVRPGQATPPNTIFVSENHARGTGRRVRLQRPGSGRIRFRAGQGRL